MKVTNEIRQAFLFAALNLTEQFTTETHHHGKDEDCFQVTSGAWKFCKGHEKNLPKKISASTVSSFVKVAFEAVETEDLMKWLTLQEKVTFAKVLLELCPNGVSELGGLNKRNLQTDLTEDR